jgi:hypothetical protein
MLKESENLLNKIVLNNNNLLEIMKIEVDTKILKQLEKDINKNIGMIKVLTNFINYYKMKEIKSQL